MGACPVSSSQGQRIIGPMRALVSPRDSIWVSLPLYFKSEHFIIYVFLCNSRTHIISLYSVHASVVLCVNASVLAPHMDPS
jgi:hypothetical protein